MKTGASFSSFNLFETVGQSAEEVLSLLVKAKPQIQLQLSLNGPACRTEPLLTRQLWTQNAYQSIAENTRCRVPCRALHHLCGIIITSQVFSSRDNDKGKSININITVGFHPPV